jgi:hypothetical protein
LDDDYVGIYTQFGPGIMGSFMLPADAKIVARRERIEEEELPEGGRREIHPLVVVSGIVVVIFVLILLMFVSR